MTALEPQAVEALFAACEQPSGGVLIEGIVTKTTFSTDALEAHRDEIAALLHELPDEFMKSGGGGWSFLNACMDRHGNQWTGMHPIMEKLFMLGEGVGLVRCMLPRDAWPACPGGMPYYVVDDSDREQDWEEPF